MSVCGDQFLTSLVVSFEVSKGGSGVITLSAGTRVAAAFWRLGSSTRLSNSSKSSLTSFTEFSRTSRGICGSWERCLISEIKVVIRSPGSSFFGEGCSSAGADLLYHFKPFVTKNSKTAKENAFADVLHVPGAKTLVSVTPRRAASDPECGAIPNGA